MKSTLALALVAASILSHSSPASALNGVDDPSRASFYSAFKGKRVVFIPLGMGLDLTQAWAGVMRRQAETLGYKFDIRDPNWSTEAGAQALTQVITEKPDMIVVHNPDIQVYAKLLQKAQAAGIYVLQINLKSAYPTEAFVGPDWVALGQKVAQLAVDKCSPKNGGNGKIAVIQLTLTAASNIYQMKGVMDVLAKNPDIKLVSEQSGDTDANKTRALAATVLQQNPDLCAFVGGWDGSDIGAVAAIKEAGKTGKVSFFTSGGGEQNQCDKLKDGGWTAYVSYNASLQGRDLNTMIKYIFQAKPPVGTIKTNLFNDLVVLDSKNYTRANACFPAKDVY